MWVVVVIVIVALVIVVVAVVSLDRRCVHVMSLRNCQSASLTAIFSITHFILHCKYLLELMIEMNITVKEKIDPISSNVCASFSTRICCT